MREHGPWKVRSSREVYRDPWIALTAIALHTSHIKIGLLALPLPRHRPWLVAGQLANLDQLPRPFGFRVSAFPINLRGASAAWARVVATIEEESA